jgi:hypothetical protein
MVSIDFWQRTFISKPFQRFRRRITPLHNVGILSLLMPIHDTSKAFFRNEARPILIIMITRIFHVWYKPKELGLGRRETNPQTTINTELTYQAS